MLHCWGGGWNRGSLEPVVGKKPPECVFGPASLLWLSEKSHFASELVPGPSSSTSFKYPSVNSYSVQGVSIHSRG